MIPSLIIRKVNEPFANLFCQLTRAWPWEGKVNEPFPSDQLKVTAPFARVSFVRKFTFDSFGPQDVAKTSAERKLRQDKQPINKMKASAVQESDAKLQSSMSSTGSLLAGLPTSARSTTSSLEDDPSEEACPSMVCMAPPDGVAAGFR